MEKTTDVSELFDNKKLAVLVENGAGDEIIKCGEMGDFYKNDKIYYPGTAEKVIDLAMRIDKSGKAGMWFIPGLGYGNFNGDGTLSTEDFTL